MDFLEDATAAGGVDFVGVLHTAEEVCAWIKDVQFGDDYSCLTVKPLSLEFGFYLKRKQEKDFILYFNMRIGKYCSNSTTFVLTTTHFQKNNSSRCHQLQGEKLFSAGLAVLFGTFYV